MAGKQNNGKWESNAWFNIFNSHIFFLTLTCALCMFEKALIFVFSHTSKIGMCIECALVSSNASGLNFFPSRNLLMIARWKVNVNVKPVFSHDVAECTWIEMLNTHYDTHTATQKDQIDESMYTIISKRNCFVVYLHVSCHWVLLLRRFGMRRREHSEISAYLQIFFLYLSPSPESPSHVIRQTRKLILHTNKHNTRVLSTTFTLYVLHCQYEPKSEKWHS